MIRFVHCIRRREDLDAAEFRRHWESPEFDDLIRRVVAATGAVRHAKSLTLQVEMNLWVKEERGSAAPFDGLLEYMWESAGHLPALRGSAAARALVDEMAAFQRGFVDISESAAFFTDSSET